MNFNIAKPGFKHMLTFYPLSKTLPKHQQANSNLTLWKTLFDPYGLRFNKSN